MRFLVPAPFGPRRRLPSWVAQTIVISACALASGIIIGTGHPLYLMAVIAAAVAMVWPVETALTLYIFLLPFEAVAVMSNSANGSTLNWLVGGMAGMALLGTGILTNRLHWPPRPALYWLLFLAWNVITLGWALNREASMQRLPTAIAVVLLYIVAVCWDVTEKQLTRIGRFAILSGSIAACYSIHLFFSGVTYRSWTTRASLIVGGRETNPDLFAIDLLIPLSFCLAEILRPGHRVRRLLALTAGGTMVLAVFLSGSRAAMLGLGVIALIYTLRLGFNRRVLLIPLAFAVMVIAMPEMFLSRVQEAVQTGGAGRVDIWKGGIAALGHYWLAGAGMSNFPIAYNDFAGQGRIFQGFARGAHNIYLQIGVEVGVVGLVLFCLAALTHLRLVASFRGKFDRLPLQVIATESMCWSMLLVGFFGTLLWEKSFWVSWMLLLIAVRTHQKAGRQAAATVPSQNWSPIWESYPEVHVSR